MKGKENTKFQRAIIFFLILQIGNILSYFYEIHYLKLDFSQVIALRSLAILTDILEVYIFIYIGFELSDFIKNYINKIKLNKKEIIYGIKLAIIAPNIYIIKFILANYLMIPILNDYNILIINQIDSDKIVQAYITTLILSFIFGIIYYHLENKILYIKSKIKKLLNII